MVRATEMKQFEFAQPVRAPDIWTHGGTSGAINYKSFETLSNTALTQVKDRFYELRAVPHAPLSGLQPDAVVVSDAAKPEAVLKGSVHGVGPDFLRCEVYAKNGKLEVELPLQICPEDVQFEGIAIEISVGSEGGYQSLQVRRVKGDSPPPAVQKAVADILDWVSSI